MSRTARLFSLKLIVHFKGFQGHSRGDPEVSMDVTGIIRAIQWCSREFQRVREVPGRAQERDFQGRARGYMRSRSVTRVSMGFKKCFKMFRGFQERSMNFQEALSEP